MTAETIGAPPTRAPSRFKPFQAITFTGLAIVFLLTAAALANGALGRTDFPEKFGDAATLTHFVLIFAAIPLAMAQIALPKGTPRHRMTGYAWCGLMVAAAIISFAMHEITGGFSLPHAFSIITLIMVPLIVYFAHMGRRRWHRGLVLSLNLIVIFAGSLTFIPGRAIGAMFWAIWT